MPELPKTREELLTSIYSGTQHELLFFWGHTDPEKDPDTVGEWIFSQWRSCSFTLNGLPYSSAEQYMMAEKARLFGDQETRKKIIETSDPVEAKALGRLVHQFDEKVWNQHRSGIVVAGNLAKFGQNEAYKEFLLQTGEHILVEASPHDRIWGIGLSADDPKAKDPVSWRGRNLLGFALMEVRRQLSESSL